MASFEPINYSGSRNCYNKDICMSIEMSLDSAKVNNAVTTVINAVRLRLGVVNRTGKNHSIVKRLFHLDQFTAGLFDSKRVVELWFNVVSVGSLI